MLSFTVDLASLRNAVGAISIDEQGDLLKELGTMVLSLERQNFEKKSRRGTGEEGVQWKELALSTEIHKAEKGGWRAPGRAKTDKRLSIWDSMKAAKKHPTANPPKSQIGVDTGLLRNSSMPGFTGDADGGNVFKVETSQGMVTVGYGRTYAKYFDTKRPLIPPDLPPAWEQELTQIVREFYEEKLQQNLG